MTYGGERERAEALALDQLEAIVRVVTEEIAGWRARALKAEADLKDSHPRGGSTRPDPEVRGRLNELESENKILRMRVEAARARLAELLTRLTFLEEQGRELAARGGDGAGAGAGVSK